jgi:hypothetical protein
MSGDTSGDRLPILASSSRRRFARSHVTLQAILRSVSDRIIIDAIIRRYEISSWMFAKSLLAISQQSSPFFLLLCFFTQKVIVPQKT